MSDRLLATGPRGVQLYLLDRPGVSKAIGYLVNAYGQMSVPQPIEQFLDSGEWEFHVTETQEGNERHGD